MGERRSYKANVVGSNPTRPNNPLEITMLAWCLFGFAMLFLIVSLGVSYQQDKDHEALKLKYSNLDFDHKMLKEILSDYAASNDLRKKRLLELIEKEFE